MNKLWSDEAWDEYLEWQHTDRKIADKINQLIKSVEREGLSRGLGKPEPLRNRKAWSRRIDHANRLIYTIDKQGHLWILSCKGHYED